MHLYWSFMDNILASHQEEGNLFFSSCILLHHHGEFTPIIVLLYIYREMKTLTELDLSQNIDENSTTPKSNIYEIETDAVLKISIGKILRHLFHP